MIKTTRDRADALARQRETLRLRCAMQRRQLGESASAIEHQLHGIDHAVRLVRGFASKPTLVTAGIAALSLIGPKKALRWVSQGAFWYTTLKRLAKVVSATGVLQRNFGVPRRSPSSSATKPPRVKQKRRAQIGSKPRVLASRRDRLLPEKS